MFNFGDISFQHPWVLLLLILIPIFVTLYILRNRSLLPVLRMSLNNRTEKLSLSGRGKFYWTLFALRMMALAFIILAIARPQSKSSKRNVFTEGIDIIISLDISGSMLSEDFKPNRLEASKEVAKSFIENRPQDRIGLVIFSGESFTQCPLTSDHKVLSGLIDEVYSGMIEDGTAIGDGLGTAINRLRYSKSKSKVVILLTDGVNNMGFMDPMSAAEIAKDMGIRVYTIGVGKMGKAPYPFKTPMGIQYQQVDVEIDEELLKEISEYTGVKYFRATDKNKLEEIYKEIDAMEKTIINVMIYDRRSEEYFPLLMIALICLLAEFILRKTIFKTVL